MPELPEVENIVRILRPKVVGKEILAVEAFDPKLQSVPQSLGVPARVFELVRKGKYIVFDLGERKLVLHLRMSGHLFWTPSLSEIPKHTRLSLRFSDGTLLFVDPRRLGTAEVVEEFAEPLGPDALGDLSFLNKALQQSRAPIKLWLLDQRNIAGLGNIYVCEALFLAGIDPRRPASSLTKGEVAQLKEAIHRVLREALEAMGTTLTDEAYRTPEGESGDYEPRVYGREGLPCLRCGTPIVRIELGGRGTYFCPRCQR